MIRSSLAKHVPSGPASATDLVPLRRAALEQQGVAMIRLDDVESWRLKQEIINEAKRQIGALRGKE